jgi:hypothetical protein
MASLRVARDRFVTQRHTQGGWGCDEMKCSIGDRGQASSRRWEAQGTLPKWQPVITLERRAMRARFAS